MTNAGALLREGSSGFKRSQGLPGKPFPVRIFSAFGKLFENPFRLLGIPFLKANLAGSVHELFITRAIGQFEGRFKQL